MPTNKLRTGILCIVKVVSILNERFYGIVFDVCIAIEEMFREEKAAMSESSDNLKITLKESSNLGSYVKNDVTMEREEFEEFLHDLNDKLTEIVNQIQHITSGVKYRTHLGYSSSTENEKARSCCYRSKKNFSSKTNERKTCILEDKSTELAAYESESEIRSKCNFDDARNRAGPSSTSNQNLSFTGLENRENVAECKVFEIRSSSTKESDSCSRPRKKLSYRILSKMLSSHTINGTIPNKSETETESVCGFNDERSLDCQDVSGDIREMRV
ncbi:uncharacterized protein LOC118195277 [Stegodyphus dumicola]|uniref:uncharacterized protein LOC118195277 n=1 Tax=Stegodyphus dumicola TaxID=202533 RepID=UPI0015AA91AB|nr:uncharacterized protein LOC118195277 [Stegodyphus dumicola]